MTLADALSSKVVDVVAVVENDVKESVGKSIKFGPKSAMVMESTLNILSRLLILPVLEDIRSRH